MSTLFIAAGFMLGGIIGIIGTERCRRQPVKCQDWFMTKNGWSQSLFGYWFFFGRPEVARKAILENERLRRWVIIESYAKAFIFIGLGIFILMVYR